MQKMIKEYFLLKIYQQQFYLKYQNCRQGNHNVDEYKNDFDNLHTKNNMDNPEFCIGTKYIGRLKQEIKNEIIDAI